MVRTRDLDELYAASYRRLVVQLYGLCGDLADAEDAVQQAFVAAIRHSREVTELGDPEACVRAVAVRRLRSGRRTVLVRRRARAPVPPERKDDRCGVVVPRPPPFDALVSSAQRRNRHAAAAAAALTGCAAILVLGAGALSERGDDRSTPAQPPTRDGTSPETSLGSARVTPPVTTAFINRTFRVGRDPYALAVHPMTGEMYVTNRADDTVSVIDPTAQAVTTTIPVGHQPADLAIDPTTGMVYVAELGGPSDAPGQRGSGVVSVLDARSHQVVGTIALGPGELPGDVAVDPSSRSLFVTSRTDTKVLVVDTGTNQVVDAVELGWAPGAVAVNPATGEAYVTGHDGGSLAVIDTGTREVVQTGDGFGHHVAVDTTAGVLLVGDEGSGTVTVLDAWSRQPITTVDVGGYGPFSIEIDPHGARAYVTGGPDGTMAVLDTHNLVVVQDVTIPGASSVVANPVVDVERASVYLIVSRRDVGMMARK